MSFPLGSLSRDDEVGTPDKVYKRQSKKAAPPPPPRHNPLRTPVWLLLSGALWCLVVLALVSHDRADAAFSISGQHALYGNRMGAVGAWVADLLLFSFGFSAWWLLIVGLRVWLGQLADLLRADSPPAPGSRRPLLLWLLGLVLLLCASSALEWTRLYSWETRLPGHAGGVLGYSLGPWSMKVLGFAGSGVVWISLLLLGAGLALKFSWAHLAEQLGARLDQWREQRLERREKAEDQRVGE